MSIFRECRLLTAHTGLLVILTSFASSVSFGDGEQLGKMDFPNSGSAEAQADFMLGLGYLHNFEYKPSAEAFRRAQELDPEFAMAYWGEAMAYYHPLWNQLARESARKVLNKLGRTPEARAAKAPTQREKDYLNAIEVLYGNTEDTKRLVKNDREVLYRDTMRQLHERYPEDQEAHTFYGLSILGVGSHDREATTYMRAAAVLTEVWDVNREHPGAAHYLIHSYDDPVHAPLGLPMARAYSKIAPAAAHAQHMTSHIFVALGMWDDLIDANARAVEMTNDWTLEGGGDSVKAGHYSQWLHYGLLQTGRIEDATVLLGMTKSALGSGATTSERTYYGDMAARQVLDTEAWNSAAEWIPAEGIELPSANYHFAMAFAAIKRGELAEARRHFESILHNPDGRQSEDAVRVLRKEFDALMTFTSGNRETGLEQAREAANMDAGMTFAFGPPAVGKPSAELLGELLLESGDAENAAKAFKDQLDVTPGRALALAGLARSVEASGK